MVEQANMNRKPIPEPIQKYVAPRDDPLSYPGKRPPTGFIVADEVVWPIVYDDKEKCSIDTTRGGKVLLDSKGGYVTIDKFLESRGVAPIGERFAVIGYGSNSAPGQLLSKFGVTTVVPVILGTIEDSDVVYNLISNKGYAYAEMIIGQEAMRGSVGVTFLDDEQLRTIIRSEQNYCLAYAPSEVTLESGQKISGGSGGALYIFAGFRNIWVPYGHSGPIPIAELPFLGRKRRAMTQVETLGLAIEQFNLKNIGIRTPSELVAKIREEAGLQEKAGKLKYDLQKAVEEDPRSHPPLANSLTLIESELPAKTFADA